MSMLLDFVMKPLDLDEVDYNGGNCGIGHKVVEGVLKSTIKNRPILIVKLWGGGNITKVALVNFIMLIFSLLVDCKSMQFDFLVYIMLYLKTNSCWGSWEISRQFMYQFPI